LAGYTRSAEFIDWGTIFPVVSGRTPRVFVGIKLLMPLFWLGIYINISSGSAGSNTVVYKEITGSDFSGATFSNLFSATQPSNLLLTNGGSVVPKPW